MVAVFYSYFDADYQRVDQNEPFTCTTGIVAIDNSQLDKRKLRDWTLDQVDTELDLINRIIDMVNELDPDIVTGWEVQAASWGFISDRASTYGTFSAGLELNT